MCWKKLVPWLTIAFLLGALLFVSDWSDRHTEPERATAQDAVADLQQQSAKSPTMATLLDNCPPFESFDGQRGNGRVGLLKPLKC